MLLLANALGHTLVPISANTFREHLVMRAPAPQLKSKSWERPEAILFDADGTLLDSLPPHVDFCHNMNRELGLGLTLPDRSDVAACRLIAAAPMDNFFRAAGFPEKAIAGCVEAYSRRFAVENPVRPFEGVEQLLCAISEHNVPCAIVSSNTAVNVRAGLMDLSSRFSFIDGIDNAPLDKAEAIAAALEKLGVQPSAAAYVGDTRKDSEKAKAAGVRFVGVDYGFEALARDRSAVRGAPVAETVAELESLLVAMVST